MAIVHEYEVTVVLRNLATREERLHTITEYAYSAQDVPYQAVHNIPSTLHGEEMTKLVRVQPPQRLIDLAAKELTDQILRDTKSLNRT